MAHLRTRRRSAEANYWPGFVDAMATLLLVIIFILSVFMLAQFFLSQEVSSKDTVLIRLNAQIEELTELLNLERADARNLAQELQSLHASLADANNENNRLTGLLESAQGSIDARGNAITGLEDRLREEQRLSKGALSQVEILNQQIAALRRQVAALEGALEVAEERDRASKVQIANLGRRLNVALAQKVQELARYRSDFFGRLRVILGNRDDIRVVGDRFVFQSEVLFGSGSSIIGEQGSEDLRQLADALVVLQGEIPEDVDWILRVDGHTDAQPLSGTGEFKSNWELSAARAISVVTFLEKRGVISKRLVAAGFGEFRPLVEGDDPEDYAKNRRIEFRLTTQ